MNYTKLGNTDITISRICMGCMGFGNARTGQHSWTLDEESSRGIIRYALEKGINFFDTAIAYQEGTSEMYLGRALRDFARRDQVVVATKFLPRSQEEIEAGVSGKEHLKTVCRLPYPTWAWITWTCISTICGIGILRSRNIWKPWMRK